MRSRKAIVLWAAAIAYAATIFILSSQRVSGPGEKALALVGDKALHGLEYAGFAFLLALALASTPSPRIRHRATLIALVGAVAYAASDEFHQTLVPGRLGDVTDFAADSAGAAAAIAVYHIWRWRSARGAAVSGTSPR
jgi:VanZ family protein